MKKETASAAHALCDVLMGDGCWDREIQMLVDERALVQGTAGGGAAIHEPQAAAAWELMTRALNVPENYHETAEGLAEVAAIQAAARKLAEDLGFDFEEGTDPETLLPFDEDAYCPGCSYHMDDHDMRQMSTRRPGRVGECPVPVARVRRSPVKRARVARRLTEGALTEINRACNEDETVNQNKPIGRAVEKLNAVLALLKEDA